MRLRVLTCPRCGAPLPKRAALVTIVCEFCHSEVTVERYAVKADDYRRTLADYLAEGERAAAFGVGGVPVRVLGKIASGHASDVFLAERATRLSERLVAKLLRVEADEPLMHAEQQALGVLSHSTQKGADFFSTLLPQRVAFGRVEGAGFGGRTGALFREPVGFAHSLVEVGRAYPSGCDPRHVVWIWRRALELLGFVHESGYVHGALLPEHVLVSAREHGVRFVGYSCATRSGEKLRAVSPRERGFYPEPILRGEGLTPRTDLTMLARTLLVTASGDALRAPSSMPRPLAAVLEREASGSGVESAWHLNEEVSAAARESFGPPQFVELALP